MAKSNAVKEQETGKVRRYLQGVRSEFKKVIWPTKEQTINYSAVVIVISIVTSIFLYGIDRIVRFLLSLII